MLLHILNVITAYRPNKLSKKIKLETKSRHDEIEKHPFIKSMINGSLSDKKYAIYLYNLYPIYKSVEMLLFSGKNFNKDLYQSIKIESDLNNYKKELRFEYDRPEFNFNNEWVYHFYSKSFFLRKTELYIRWLADMYGGQIIKKNIKFNSKYNFLNLRESIKTIRTFLEEDLTENNVESFINEVNISYKFHHNLADKINELSEESLS